MKPTFMRSLLLLLCCAFSILSGFAQNGTLQIKGKVTDETGIGMPGVNISVKGKKLFRTTDNFGAYTIGPIQEKDVLIFSYTGYSTKEVTVTGALVNVNLVPDANNLKEVVVTALNINRDKKSLGYSVTSIDGSMVNSVQTPNIVNALSGKIAGVDVGNIANGIAGTKRIVIRGGSSLTGNNQPLWVVDGTPINTETLGGPDAFGGVDYGDGLTGLNPDDIETISVLKGNAAAALYGSLASNGVILVTTKKGKSINGKSVIDFSSSMLFDKLVNTTDFQFDYGQSGTGNEPPATPEEGFSSSSWGAKLDGRPSVRFDGVTVPFNAVKDNYERFFNTGNTLTNTVSISGSNNIHNYRISLSDLRNEDIIPNAKFNRTGVNLKTTSKFGRLTADIALNYTVEKAKNRPFIGGNVSNLFYSLAYMPGNIDVESLKPGYNADGNEFSYANSISNPYYAVNKVSQSDNKDRVTGSINLKYDFTKWLYLRGRATRDYYAVGRSRYIPGGNQFTSYPLGQLEEAATKSWVSNYELILGVKDIKIGDVGINFFVGGNNLERKRDIVNTSGNSFVVPGVYTFNNLATKLPITSKSWQKTNSFFGSLELSYHNYLYLNLTGRNDWFSTLPMDNNNLFYPAASLSFVFSDAFKLPEAISFGKLRASTAQVSGDTSPYQLDLSYSLTQVAYGGNNLQYIGTTNISNSKLQPLLSTDYELGLEMDFFKGRMGFDVSYYNKQIKNDIVRTAVSRSTGFRTAILNVGKMENQGIELLLKGTPVKTGKFQWDVSTTFTKNSNKVVTLGPGTENAPILMATAKSGEVIIQLEEGKRYGGIYGYKYKRNDAGQIVYNAQGLPQYTTKNEFLANGVYDKMLGFGNTFSFGNFALFTLVDAKWGASIYSETNALSYSNGKHKNTLIGREDGLIGEGVNDSGAANTVKLRGISNTDFTTGASSVQSYYQQISHVAEEFIYDASFVKLREVSLSYRFPKSLLSKVGISNATFSLVGRNLATLYKHKDLTNVDPESSVASGNAQGIERLVYPVTRNFGFTLKLSL